MHDLSVKTTWTRFKHTGIIMLDDLGESSECATESVGTRKPRSVETITIPCPLCGRCEELQRLRRKPWMRPVPFSRHLLCDYCSSRFLFIMNWCIFRFHL